MGRRFRVELELLSNMEGSADPLKEKEIIKSYLEGIAGVGVIRVTHLDQVSDSWLPEAPTTPTKKRRR